MNREWKKMLSGKKLREAFEECDAKGKGHFDINDVCQLNHSFST